jgi:hypothetical protein
MLAKIAEFVAALRLRHPPCPRPVPLAPPAQRHQFLAVPHTISTTSAAPPNYSSSTKPPKSSDAVYRAVSAFVGHTHGKIWLLSTPTRQNGFFFNYWHDTESGQWHRVYSNVHDCPDIDPTISPCKSAPTPSPTARNFLCQFTPPANRLCSREMAMAILRQKGDDRPSGAGTDQLSSRRRRTCPAPRKLYIGLDLGQRFDHSAIAAIEVTWRHLGP